MACAYAIGLQIKSVDVCIYGTMYDRNIYMLYIYRSLAKDCPLMKERPVYGQSSAE